ncbi:hypothetical protein [Rossellomorea sp. BNER]|uniref:hypothetical protein n=1 Tax=Rossellomorea sp. BNER TaxID=2962031 RepID=UPI003AF2771A|nr:hypothetical protein [Rossellomorea sp. BNER]
MYQPPYYYPNMRYPVRGGDQRFFPFFGLPFIAGGLAGLAISPFLWGGFGGRPCCPPYYPPYSPYGPGAYGGGAPYGPGAYGGAPYGSGSYSNYGGGGNTPYNVTENINIYPK